MHNLYELQFAKGLKDLVVAEAADLLPAKSRIFKNDSQESLKLKLRSSFDLAELRTVNSAYYLLSCNGQRPSTVLGDVNWQRIKSLVDTVKSEFNLADFKLSMPGKDSKLAGRIIEKIGDECNLELNEKAEKSLSIIIRKSLYADDSWDVLIRTTPLPLSKRDWRVSNYPGAVNAALAAAIINLTEPKAEDCFLNLMSGSGTFLIERALAGKYKKLVGVDKSAAAISAAKENVLAASIRDITLIEEATQQLELASKFNVIVADPPWGERIADKQELRGLYINLFNKAASLAADQAQLIVLTQETELMKSISEEVAKNWRKILELKVYQGGYNPLIYQFKLD